MTQPVERASGTPFLSVPLTIRPALMSDVELMVALQAVAFEDKFRAAFGRRRIDLGVKALIRSHHIQGSASLAGMYIAEHDGTLIGTITLRTIDMRFDDADVIEQALMRELGAWGTTRAIHMLSQIEHRIDRREAYITDVAVAVDWRRHGVAGAMLSHVATQARHLGKTYLGLYVNATNTGAIDLYYRFGFREQRIQRVWWSWLLFRQSRWVYMTCHLG